MLRGNGLLRRVDRTFRAALPGMAFPPIPAVASTVTLFAFVSLFELQHSLEGRSRLVAALVSLFGCRGSLPSRRACTAAWSSGPTSLRGGVSTVGVRTQAAFKNGLRVQFPLAFGFKARARLRSPPVTSGARSSTGASASPSKGTKATVAIPYRDGSGLGYFGLKGRPGYRTGSHEGVLHVFRIQTLDPTGSGWSNRLVHSRSPVMGVGPDIYTFTSPVSKATPSTAIAFCLMLFLTVTEESVQGVRPGRKLHSTAPHHTGDGWGHCHMESIPVGSVWLGRCKICICICLQ